MKDMTNIRLFYSGVSYIVRNIRTRHFNIISYWVNIRGLFNPKHIDRVNILNLLNSQNKSDLDESFIQI